MKSKPLLLVVLVICVAQAQGPNTVEPSARDRTATPWVAALPGDALPSDSLNCRLIGQYPNPGGSRYGVGDVVDSLVYLTAGDSGMDIFSVSNPASPYLVGHIIPTGSNNFVVGIDVEGSYAYVAAGSYFDVIDVSNPADPSEVGKCTSGGWAVGVVKRGNYAYVTDYTHGLRVIDVSDPANPSKVGFCSSFGAQALALSGNYAYVSNAYADSLDGLRIIDISSPTAPTESSYFRTYCAEGLDVLDANHVFVNDGTAMRVIDVSDPASPVQVGFYDNDNYCFGVDVVGNYAYAAGQTGGLFVMDVSDPTDPQKVGHWRTDSSSTQSVRESGGYVYVSDYYAGLLIFEFYAMGVGEGRRPPVCSSQLTATIVRGVLFLSEDRGPKTEDRVALVDAAGRRVMELHPGPNDVQRLTSGVYFVSSPKSVEKVLLTR